MTEELVVAAEPMDDHATGDRVRLRVLDEGVFVGTLTITVAAHARMGYPSELYVKIGNNVC